MRIRGMQVLISKSIFATTLMTFSRVSLSPHRFTAEDVPLSRDKRLRSWRPHPVFLRGANLTRA